MSQQLKVLKRVWGFERNPKKTKIVLKHLYKKDIKLNKVYKTGLGKYVKQMRHCDNNDVCRWAKGLFNKWKRNYKHVQ